MDLDTLAGSSSEPGATAVILEEKLEEKVVVPSSISVYDPVEDPQEQSSSVLATLSLTTFWAPRLLLAGVACIYGSNFPLGAVMDQALPYASAAASARFFLAALALSPFMVRLKPELMGPAMMAGAFTATGYVAQALALGPPYEVPPATVSFLGALTVVWCPLLECWVDGTDTSWKARPQVWVAGVLCLMGVGLLELFGVDDIGGGDVSSVSWRHSTIVGDGLAVLQAIGFGTGLFMSERMMKRDPQQALPVTAVMVAVTALFSLFWVISDGWMGNAPGYESMLLPSILLEGLGSPDGGEGRVLALAVLWTGLVSTSLNFYLEVFAMGKVPCGEASVVLATEPLWAAAFANLLLGQNLGWNDAAGGIFIVSACLVNGLSTDRLHKLLPT